MVRLVPPLLILPQKASEVRTTKEGSFRSMFLWPVFVDLSFCGESIISPFCPDGNRDNQSLFSSNVLLAKLRNSSATSSGS